ncbi:hypothetical protein HPB49_010756 [Dermacentor silvarum]|uniref:Uncharacterized protein n=1 Tax=Dermacentor silvarum TaxID=543639 RepID=A0ACB8DYY5_DERSI|nr:hypothetical protein HPB49_010756 [Dermacentor silvarum]
MNKASPRLPSSYISCGDGSPLQNEAGNKFPRSPTMRRLEDDGGISRKVAKLATLSHMPLSSHVRQKQQTKKVCVMCKRRDISDAGGQDTCIRCFLCKQITKEQAAIKEKGAKERLAAPEPDTPAKLHKRRASSDVKNRERDAKTHTCPLSSRSDDRVKVDTVSPQGKKHQIVSKKRARKTYLTKPVILSSDESCSEDDGFSATATAVSASQQVEAAALPSVQPRQEEVNTTSGEISPALVITSSFSLTLTDWEGLKNESIDGAESVSVGGMTGKIAATSTLASSDSGLPGGKNGDLATGPGKCAAEADSPPIVISDSSDDELKEKDCNAVNESLMGLPYLVRFEDDGAMSVTIQDGASGCGQVIGFPAKESGALAEQAQEAVAFDSSDADYLATFTECLQKISTTVIPEGDAEKTGLSKQGKPVAVPVSAPAPSRSGGSSISVDTSDTSGQHTARGNFNTHAHLGEHAHTGCSGSSCRSLVSLGAPAHSSLCTAADPKESCVEISYTAQGAIGGGSLPCAEDPVYPKSS